MQPLILLTFANDSNSAHLPLLKAESKAIWSALSGAEAKNYIKVHQKESITTDELIADLTQNPDALAIFHYGGHAGNDGLQFEDGTAHGAGLATLLGQQKNLQLVFLNGCSTYEQVAALLRAGVPAVIATKVPIGDEQATYFSTQFYKALANKRTVAQAFEMAHGALQTTSKSAPVCSIKRGFDIAEVQAEIAAELNTTLLAETPWVFITNTEKSTALNYKLPYYQELTFGTNLQTSLSNITSNKVNQNIIAYTLQAMCSYNKDIYSQLVTLDKGVEKPKDSATYLDVIMQNLPWMIGMQLQLLRQKQTLDADRLAHLLSTYITTLRVIYFVLLANFWKACRTANAKIPDDFHQKYTITKDNIATFSYLQKIIDLCAYFEQENIPLFMPEITDFCATMADDAPSKTAAKFLNDLLVQYPDYQGDITKNCINAERAVAYILRNTAFLASYRFTMVRSTSLYNPLYSDVLYDAQIGSLNPINLEGPAYYEDIAQRRKKAFTQQNSIVVLRTDEDVSEGLNLSPFIIDINTYLNNPKPDIYMFAYSDDANQTFHYHAIIHSIFLAIKNENGTDIRHTDMTQDDFESGRNITDNDKKDDVFADYDALFSTAKVTGAAAAESPRVLQSLAALHHLYLADFTV